MEEDVKSGRHLMKLIGPYAASNTSGTLPQEPYSYFGFKEEGGLSTKMWFYPCGNSHCKGKTVVSFADTALYR